MANVAQNAARHVYYVCPLPAHSGCSNAVPSDAMTLHHPLSQRMRLRRGRTQTPCAQSNLGKGAACSTLACLVRVSRQAVGAYGFPSSFKCVSNAVITSPTFSGATCSELAAKERLTTVLCNTCHTKKSHIEKNTTRKEEGPDDHPLQHNLPYGINASMVR